MQHVAKNQSVVRYSVFGSAIKLLSLLAFVAVSYGAGVSASRADTSPSFICGVSTVRDVDGNIYHTTDVHGQCWMSENMRVGTMILGGTDQTSDGSIEKYCYNNDLTNCATDGGLYQWDEAMQYSTTEGAQGICPAGWHIPTDVEFYTLEHNLKLPENSCNGSRVGGSAWDCYNAGGEMKVGGSSGLNFPPSGAYIAASHIFDLSRENTPIMQATYIWSSLIGTNGQAWLRALNFAPSIAGVDRFEYPKENGFTVRCVQGDGAQPPVNHAPEITLKGDNPMTITQGSVFVDPGATATDAEDGDITANVSVSGSVDVSTLGTYLLTYSVEDSSHDVAQVTRTINVIARASVMPPYIVNLAARDGYMYVSLMPIDSTQADLVSSYKIVVNQNSHTITMILTPETDALGYYSGKIGSGLDIGKTASVIVQTIGKDGSTSVARSARFIPDTPLTAAKLWAGTLPTLVFIHGYNEDATVWDRVTTSLHDLGLSIETLNADAAGDHITAVHGTGANQTVKDANVYAVSFPHTDYSDDNPCVDASYLGTYLQSIFASTGGRGVILLGHSQGGVVERLYLQASTHASTFSGRIIQAKAGWEESLPYDGCEDVFGTQSQSFFGATSRNDGGVLGIVTYGTPHQGVDLTLLGVKLNALLQKGSGLLAALNDVSAFPFPDKTMPIVNLVGTKQSYLDVPSDDCLVTTESQDMSVIPKVASMYDVYTNVRKNIRHTSGFCSLNFAWLKTNETEDTTGIFGAVDKICKARGLDCGKIPSTELEFELHSPADLVVTDPSGRSISKDVAGIWGATYNELPDEHNDLKDYIDIPFPLPGKYTINVIPDHTAAPTKTFSITMNQDGVESSIVENQQIGSVVSDIPYIAVAKGDAVAPTTTPSLTGTLSPGSTSTYLGTTTIALNAVDNLGGAGVASTTYSLDNGPWKTYASTSPLQVTASGDHTLQFFSTDWFNNQEATSTLNFSIIATGKLVVTKKTLGGDGTFSFMGDAGTFSITTLAGVASTSISSLVPGIYAVTESPLSGWTLVSNDCSQVSVIMGEVTRCTVTNTKQGHIVVKNVASTTTTVFPFVASYSTAGFNVGAGSQNDSGLLDPGTYAVTENIPDGWVLASSTCSDGSSVGAIVLDPGETVTCTFTNVKGVDKNNASISGVKFEDKNGNGKQDSGEKGLFGWVIYIDANNNGRFDWGERFTITNFKGEYQLRRLSAGTYTVREVLWPGWQQMFPAAGSYSVKVSAGQAATGKDFGNFKKGRISGTVFEDKDGNGRLDRREGSLGGWTVTLAGPGGVTKNTTTDQNGRYSFTDLISGTYTVREALKVGWKQTTKNASAVVIQSGTYAQGVDVGVTKVN